jgi:hypothetical protein
MALGRQTVSTTTPTTLIPATVPDTTTTTATTKAKVYLGTDNSFTVSNSGTTLYGNNGNGNVTLTTGITSITLDQNIGQINLPNTLNSYKFKQTGNIINVYDTADNLIVKAPVQGDADNTVLSFIDGTASVKLSGGVMKLGENTVSSGMASGW